MENNVLDINDVIQTKKNENLFTTQGYGIVSKTVMTMKGLHPMSKCIYAYFQTFNGNDNMIYPSQKTMMADLEIKDAKTLRKYLNQLEEFGLIKIQKTFNKEKNQYSNNVYYIAEEYSVMEKWKKEYQEKKSKEESKETTKGSTKEEIPSVESIAENKAVERLNELLQQPKGLERHQMLLIYDDDYSLGDTRTRVKILSKVMRDIPVK